MVLHHNYLGALPKRLNVNGLRARAGNIQVGGNDILAELFTEPRFNSWCVGEFHILNKKILPNGRRDNFEQSVHYTNFQSHVSKIATALSRTCRARSGARNLLKATDHNLQKIKSEHPAGNLSGDDALRALLVDFVILFLCSIFSPPYFRFNQRSRTDLGSWYPPFQDESHTPVLRLSIL